MRLQKATELRGSVVAMSDATSDVGRATVLDLGDRGANLVIAARRAEALDEGAALQRRNAFDNPALLLAETRQ